MEPENWVAVIAAAIGSAGLSGFATGAVQFGRASRAARTVEQLMKAAPETSTGTGAAAAKEAINQARLRLAAIALVTQQTSIKVLLVVVTVTASTIAGYAVYNAIQGNYVAQNVWGGAAAMIAYLIAVATLADLLLLRRRAWFVEAAQEPDAVISDTAAAAMGGGSLKDLRKALRDDRTGFTR